jgi:tetratricopeptide (TPR) repeat protein
MLTKNMLKSDIERELSGRAEFTQMDMLERYLKLMPPIEMRKFAYLKLAEIYLGRRMFNDAAKALGNAAVNCLTFREKVECLIKVTKAYIDAGNFEEADKSLKKALLESEQRNRKNIYEDIVEYYNKQAESLNKGGKKGHASKYYEKLLKMKINDEKKEEIKSKLEEIYERLGKMKELRLLRGI